MHRLRRGVETGANPVRTLAVCTLVSLIAIIGLFWLLSTSPHVAGQAGSYTLHPQAYRFSGLEVRLDHLELLVPEGYLVPLQHLGEISGVVILGYGEYFLGHAVPEDMERQTGQPGIHDRFTAAYSPLGYAQVEHLRYLLEASEVPSHQFEGRVQEYLDVVRAPTALWVFDTPHPVYSQPSDVLMHIQGESYGQVIYQEDPDHRGATATFTSLSDHQIQLAGRSGNPPPPAWQISIRSTTPAHVIAFASLVVILFFCLTTVFTVDLWPRSHVDSMGPLGHGELLILMLALPLAVAVQFFLSEPAAAAPNSTHTVIAVALVGVAAGVISARLSLSATWREVPVTSMRILGLTPSRPLLSLPLGLGLGWLTFLVGYGSIPAWSQFEFHRVDLGLVAAALGLAVSQEVFFRGYLQGQTQRWLGPLVGLVVASLAASLMISLPAILHAELPPDLMLTQVLVLGPMAALIYGYLTYQTGSVWASALARGLHFFLLFIFRP